MIIYRVLVQAFHEQLGGRPGSGGEHPARLVYQQIHQDNESSRRITSGKLDVHETFRHC
jgi:hypothetical protein